MKISLDSGLTWIDAPEGVRVSYDVLVWNEDIQDNVEDGELLVSCTDEGIISDVFDKNETIGSESEMAQEIADRLTGE